MNLRLETVVKEIANALVIVDRSRVPYTKYQPGVGPYAEPTLIKRISKIMNSDSSLKGLVKTQRTPDLLIKGQWALEFKLARPFGDNGKEAENWSVNLLHPYEGNTSSIGDCIKLLNSNLTERKAVIVIGYEHDPPKIPLDVLVKSFEILSKCVMKINLSQRIEENRKNLVHPVLQQLTVYAWEVIGRDT